ncbi:MAG: hypothetical protein U1F60_09515 [Planctomycetota bacterium]
MAHAPGWIELYGLLEAGRQPPAALVRQCLGNCNQVGETMLAWYALEGSPEVLQRMLDLGFPVDACRCPDDRPIVRAARIGRWDNVRVFRRAGASTRGVTPCGFTYRGLVTEAGDEVPMDLRGDAYSLDDLLDFDGPEDTPVFSVALEQPQLTADAFARFRAERPDLARELERLGVEWEWDEFSGVGLLRETSETTPDSRRVLHQVAKAIGARVRWEFHPPRGFDS